MNFYLDNIEFGFRSGNFDQFQVYNTSNGITTAPLDIDYIGDLLSLQNFNDQTYNNFLQIYNRTNKYFNPEIIELIQSLSLDYQHYAPLFRKTLVNLYLTMIAEENRANTRLGKRIKHLAIYRTLIEGIPINTSANESRGQSWRTISASCTERGF